MIWSHSLTEEYGRISGYGGRVTSPTVVDNLVIVGMLNASGRASSQLEPHRRLRQADRSRVWWAITDIQPTNTYYSGQLSP